MYHTCDILMIRQWEKDTEKLIFFEGNRKIKLLNMCLKNWGIQILQSCSLTPIEKSEYRSLYGKVNSKFKFIKS